MAICRPLCGVLMSSGSSTTRGSVLVHLSCVMTCFVFFFNSPFNMICTFGVCANTFVHKEWMV